MNLKKWTRTNLHLPPKQLQEAQKGPLKPLWPWMKIHKAHGRPYNQSKPAMKSSWLMLPWAGRPGRRAVGAETRCFLGFSKPNQVKKNMEKHGKINIYIFLRRYLFTSPKESSKVSGSHFPQSSFVFGGLSDIRLASG